MTLFLLVNIALDGAAASAGALALLESANQSGKRTIVTRATSGLGLETALDLVRILLVVQVAMFAILGVGI
jgi:hypothetical protein